MANELFKKVIESTGLPLDLIDKELCQVLEKNGLSPSEVSIEELRTVLSGYLRQVISSAKDKYENGATVEMEIEADELGEDDDVELDQ